METVHGFDCGLAELVGSARVSKWLVVVWQLPVLEGGWLQTSLLRLMLVGLRLRASGSECVELPRPLELQSELLLLEEMMVSTSCSGSPTFLSRPATWKTIDNDGMNYETN